MNKIINPKTLNMFKKIIDLKKSYNLPYLKSIIMIFKAGILELTLMQKLW
jgi:hypothetical protein